MDQGCDLCRVKKFSVVSSTGFGKFQMFLHPKPPQKDISVHSVPVLLGLVAWQLPLCLCSHHPARVLHALTALDHTNTGVVLCPIDVEVTTPHKSVGSLQQSWQYQEPNLAPSPLSSLLRTELWHTPESCDSPFLLNLCFHCLFR